MQENPTEYVELFGNHHILGNYSHNALTCANNLFAQSCVLSFAKAFMSTPYDPLLVQCTDFAQGLGMIPSEYGLSDIGATCMVVAGGIALVASMIIERAEINSIVSTIRGNIEENPEKIRDYVEFFQKNPDSSVMLKTCYILALHQFSDEDLSRFKEQQR